MRIGYFLSSEEFGPSELLAQAQMAERAGFEGLWISDHFHPWTDEQGESSFVWSMLGALSQVCELHVTTAVTCPTVRIHPAIIAQAAATSALLLEGKFALGLGSGEALNEHILGDRWPPARQRLDMLEEAVHVIRALFDGKVVHHHGPHYTVEHARLYTRPDRPPPIYLSAFAQKSARLAGRIGDGLCTNLPDPELIKTFRDSGGETKPVQGGMKVCVSDGIADARATAHRLWKSDQLPGELGQVLPTPEHITQATSLVTEDMVGNAVVCGDDVDAHVNAVMQFADAGFDELYISQIGVEQERFFSFYADNVLPRVGPDQRPTAAST